MNADVIRSAGEAEGLDRPPLLILDPLEHFLDAQGLGSGPAAADAIGDGHSNATFLIERGGRRMVLRRPPRPPIPPGAHDMVREGRLLEALEGSGVPVPKVLAICEDEDVIGAPFIVMEHVEGHVVGERVPAGFESEADRGRIADALVQTLVAVHAVDLDATGLDRFGRRGGYLDRQLRRFSGSWEANRTRELPAMDQLARELAAAKPEVEDVTLVHGDFRLGNVILAAEPPARVAALLDWEMGTIGDPLADVGYLCATWTDRRDETPPRFHLSPVTAEPGFPLREQLVARYEELSGRPVRSLPFYTALALWKSAVFMEGNYRRAQAGMTDDPWVMGFREGVEELAELGLRAIGDR